MAMEIEGGILPPDIRFEKLCKMYSLRVLKMQRNNPIQKAYIEYLKKGERDKELGVKNIDSDLESNLDTSQDTSQSRTQQPIPQTNLIKKIKGVKPFIRNWPIKKVSSKRDKPWQKEMQAQFFISLENKRLAAMEHKILYQKLQKENIRNNLIFYTNGSKERTCSAAIFYRERENQAWLTDSWNLGPYLEIMDSELYAIYKALVEANRQAQTNREIKNAYIFIDSQAAIKRLLNLSKTGGQHTTWKVHSLVDKLSQQNISTKFYWVPGHYGIYGNEMADKAAKAAQEKEVIEDSFTSLS